MIWPMSYSNLIIVSNNYDKIYTITDFERQKKKDIKQTGGEGEPTQHELI